METGGLSAVDIVLWILAVNAILILIAFGAVYWLRKQVQESIRLIVERIQELDSRLDQIANFLHEFGEVNEEPYASPLDELQKEATDLREQMNQYLTNSQNFEKETRSAGANRLQTIINSPINWYRRWRQSAVLRQEGDSIAQRLSEAEGRVERVYELPWDQATQCRQAEKDMNELEDIAQGLRAKGARGAALQTVLTQIPLLQRALDEIPSEFLDANREALLNVANLDSTIRVFEALNRIRPALARYLPQAREWNTAYQKATAEFAELKQLGANLRQIMANPPEGLVVEAQQERLDQVAQMAAELSQQLAQPEVENLKPLAREVSQLHRVLKDTEQQMGRASQQVSELSKALADLRQGLDHLAEQFSELEQREDFPLAWDQSSGLFGDLRKRLELLGPAQQPRTPEQISQHLKETEALRAGHQTHAEALPKVADRHRALVTLLESAEIRDGSTWLRKARDTLRQVAAYDPRNWPKQDGLPSLPVELDELAGLHETLVPADRSAPIKESELEQRLKETQQLAAQHKSLRPRVENVRTRLEKIQALEKEAKERLTESFNALDRVSLLAESNDLLDEIATAEIDRLREEIRQLGNELNAQNQGEVEKKQQKIQALAEKVNKALNAWLARLSTAIAERGKAINDRLIQVDAVAQVDEPAITEARNVLLGPEYLTALQSGGTAAPASAGLRGMAAKVAERSSAFQRAAALNDLEATAEIKRKNDLWQTLLGVQQALDEKTRELLAAYQEIVQARAEAQESLAEVGRRLPDKRTWPPSNQTPLTEDQALRPVDEKWDLLKTQPRKAEQAVVEIERLTKQYQLATDRAKQLMNRIDQDEERVQELEDQINGLKQRWQSQSQAASGNPVIREGVQQLMSQADSKLAFIKHQYMRDALSYEQVIHNLQLLCDELFSARVAVDDEHDIGLNESHSQAQQTR